MFFHRLQHFSPYSGHLYDALKVPFIKKRDGVYSRSDSRFDLMDREGYFPFRELIRDGHVYFISDEDLLDFLKITEDTLDHYEVDYWPGWNIEFKEQLAKCFTDGYEQDKSDFEQNLGITYTALKPEQQLPYLRAFCLYCLDFLFFEGDLVDTLFYNLGYLQASLYRGFVEINHLLALSPDGNAAIRLHFDSYNLYRELAKRDEPLTLQKQLPTKPETEKQPQNSIELLCDISEIKKLWSVLTEPIKTKNGIEAAVFSKTELQQFLGSVFSSGAFPDSLKTSDYTAAKITSRGDMRNVLNALMYATYNINREFNRSAGLIQYVTILKRYFAVFACSGTDSIKSVIATHAPKGLDILKDSISDNLHIEEMLQILKKHKLLH
ncbi:MULTISPECIES: hypothetical protein [Sphingobacterium]|nr:MULTISPECIES: hypothetical protein [Sphingobacterium]